MDEFFLHVYLSEVQWQCQLSLNAFQALNDDLVPRFYGAEPIDKALDEEIFRNIHSFLTHAGNVSRLLWPPPNSNVERGQILCEILDLPGEHALKSRNMRNHFEHFDERLDKWLKAGKHRNVYVQGVIGGPSGVSDDEIGKITRSFDTKAGRFYFYGEVYDLRAVADALADVLDRAQFYSRYLRSRQYP